MQSLLYGLFSESPWNSESVQIPYKIINDFFCAKVTCFPLNYILILRFNVTGVQAKVKERLPMALFIHCYAHRLNLVLTKGTSNLKDCKIFFAHLNGLAAFFSRSPRRTQLLDDICRRRLLCVAPTRWQYTSRLVSTDFENRVAIKELFHHILEHHDEYDEDSVRVLMDLMHVWMILSFVFCFTHLMGFLSIQMCFLQCYRTKHWMYNSVWQGWRSFVTPLSERGADLMRSTKPLRASHEINKMTRRPSWILLNWL